MRSLPFLGLILTSVAFAQDATQGISSPNTKVQSFPALEQRVGGTWLARWNAATNTPSRIYGTGMALPDWRENTIEEARRQAHNAIAKHSDLLQLGASEYREVIGSRMGRSWTLTFDQFFRDLPCIGGRVDVRINMKGVLAMLGSTAWQVPAGFDIVPAISDLQAQAKAWIALDQSPTGVPQPGAKAQNRLVIWGDVTAADAAPFYLAWEVPVSNLDANGNGPIRTYYIDAKTSDVLHWENVKHECGNTACRNPHHGIARSELVGPPALPAPVATTVTVMGFTRTGQSAIATVVNTPLTGLVVVVPGIGTRTTDNNGEFTIDIAAPVSINVTGLDGRHAALIADTFIGQPTASVTVTPGVPATLQFLTAAATQDEAAHTNTHYWVDEANEWARSILGNSLELNQADAVLPTVNRTGNCNAFYTGNTINFYRQGSCNNSAFSTVIVHEWGHGLDDRYGGISQTQGLSEGWGDILGMYLVDNPVVGIDFSTGGMVRTGLNNTLYPPPAEVHAAGEVWMGFAWRLRENLRAAFGTPTAIAISNDIVVGSIAADATDQPSAVEDVFIADDDDGNLLNGVPHYTQLSAAATTKNLPFPVFQPVSLQHTALLDTTARLTPRLVNTTALPNDAGTVSQVRLVFSAAGSPTTTRVMVPNGSPNGFRAMLPGLDTGLVTYHLEATSTTGVARSPATGELSYEVTASGGPGPFVGFFSETFEGTAPGWTHARVSGASTEDWQLGIPAGKSGTSSGVTWADPAVAGGGTRVYATDLGTGTSNGSYPASMNYYLRTPVMNCSGRQGVTLRFKRWLTVEEGIFDRAVVSVNGIEVWSNPQNGHLRDTSWQTFEYALPAADNNPSVQVEWRLITDGGLQLGGWNIDDVEIGTRAVPPLPATLRMVPEQSVAGGPMLLSINTGGTGKLFVLIIGDTAGPTFVSPFPPAQVGGTLDFIVGFSDVAGLYNTLFASFGGMPPTGLLLYTQVLVFEPAGTYTMSNQHLNLFTQ